MAFFHCEGTEEVADEGFHNVSHGDTEFELTFLYSGLFL